MDEEAKKDEHRKRWSYSRMTCFGHCKYEYYLQYILKDDDLYPTEGNYYAEVGSFVHEILAKVFAGELKDDEALDYFVDNYDNNVCYKAKPATVKKNYAILADYFAELDTNWLKDYEIIGVELESNFKLDDYDCIGYIDLLLRDKRDGRIVLIDHKSSDYPFKKDGTVKKSSEHSFGLYKKQMYLYCHAIYQMYGEFPKEITWNHFKCGGQFATIPFSQSEYEEAMQWFRNTLKTIKKEKKYEPQEEYFYCANLCNFRHSCEYHKSTIRKSWGKK